MGMQLLLLDAAAEMTAVSVGMSINYCIVQNKAVKTNALTGATVGRDGARLAPPERD